MSHASKLVKALTARLHRREEKKRRASINISKSPARTKQLYATTCIANSSWGKRMKYDNSNRELERANSLRLKMEFHNNYPLFSFLNIST